MFHSRILLLTQEETTAYIARRLATAGCADSSLFPPEVVKAIYAFSRGIPRVVNLLAEHALISAYAAQQHVISPEIIRRIAVDFDLIAEPLTIKDPQGQPHVEPLVPYPVIEISEPASQCAVKLDPIPVMSRPAPAQSSEPAASRGVVLDPVPVVSRPAPAQSSEPAASRGAVLDPVPVVSRPAPVESSEPAASAARASRPVDYWRTVSDSFIRDCRSFFRTLTLP
jgi:hypothetical protein